MFLILEFLGRRFVPQFEHPRALIAPYGLSRKCSVAIGALLSDNFDAVANAILPSNQQVGALGSDPGYVLAREFIASGAAVGYRKIQKLGTHGIWQVEKCLEHPILGAG